MDRFPFVFKSIRSMKRNKSIAITKKKGRGEEVIIRWTLSMSCRETGSPAKSTGTRNRTKAAQPSPLLLAGAPGKAKPFCASTPRSGGLIENGQVWERMGKAIRLKTGAPREYLFSLKIFRAEVTRELPSLKHNRRNNVGVTVLSCDIFFWEGAVLAANSRLEGSQLGDSPPPHRRGSHLSICPQKEKPESGVQVDGLASQWREPQAAPQSFSLKTGPLSWRKLIQMKKQDRENRKPRRKHPTYRRKRTLK